MLSRQSVLAFLTLILLSGAAAADEAQLAGSDAPDFIAATQAWLAGEDRAGLEGLAALSREGNAAAQILLASIASRGNMHVHVTSQMPREARIALLRIPGGLSGKSWLTEAQRVEPLATALLQSARIGERGAAVAALVELGEPLTALLAAQTMLFNGEAEELVAVLQGLDGHLPEEAGVLLVWALRDAATAGVERYVGSARIASAISGDPRFVISELAWSIPGPRDVVENEALRQKVMSLVDEVDSWTPMKRFCESHCPDTLPSCVTVGISALSLAGPFSMRSPLESAVSNERYWSSPRLEGDLARQTPDVRLWSPTSEYAGLAPCFFDAMTRAQAIHGYGR